MVLRVNTRESRSSPGQPRTDQRTIPPSHRIRKASRYDCARPFLFVGRRQWSPAAVCAEGLGSRCRENSAKPVCGIASSAGAAMEAPSPRTCRFHWSAIDCCGRELVREFESSPGAFRAFCSTCGSPVYGRTIRDPDHIRARLGTLSSEAEAKITAHLWVRSKPSRYAIADSLPQYDPHGLCDRQGGGPRCLHMRDARGFFVEPGALE